MNYQKKKSCEHVTFGNAAIRHGLSLIVFLKGVDYSSQNKFSFILNSIQDQNLRRNIHIDDQKENMTLMLNISFTFKIWIMPISEALKNKFEAINAGTHTMSN